MTRSLRLALYGLGAATLACAAPAARFETTEPGTELAPRRAPGVIQERVASLPAPSPPNAHGSVLVLRAALRPEAATRAVADYFSAVVEESNSKLEALLSDRALLEGPGGRDSVKGAWQKRFTELDYTMLRGKSLYRTEDLEVYRATEARALSPSRDLPPELPRESLLVRVHVTGAHVDRVRFLADEIEFLLEPSGHDLLISRIREDFRAP